MLQYLSTVLECSKMNKRINQVVASHLKDKATAQTVLAYHDGLVNCRLIDNKKTGKYFITGQIARCVVTGRFVPFSQVFA